MKGTIRFSTLNDSQLLYLCMLLQFYSTMNCLYRTSLSRIVLRGVQTVTTNGKKSSKFCDIPFAYHEEVVVTIDELDIMGIGIGKHIFNDGRKWTIKAPLTLPGELCKVKIYKNHDCHSESDLGIECIFVIII